LIKISKKAVFFDFGDTLASTDPPYIIRIANGFRNAGYDISNKDFSYAYLKADCEIYKKHKIKGTISSHEYNSWFFPILCEFLNIDETPDEIRLRIRKNNTPRRFSRAVLPGTFELLSYLKVRGYTLGVISNNDGFTDRKCKDLDIDKFFDIIADSTNLGYVKPDPRIFQHVLNELGLEPEDCLHVIAAKAVAFKEALQPEFKEYQTQIVKNAQTMAERLKEHGFNILTGGTDTHLVLVDLINKELTGKETEEALDRAGITVNKNAVPFDPNPPMITSGMRIGTPAITTRGMKEQEMVIISDLIAKAVENKDNESELKKIEGEVRELCLSFPIYKELLN